MYELTEDNRILDENGHLVATALVRADGQEIVAALNFIEDAVEEFPGLTNNDESVNGGDFVQFFGERFEFHEDGRYQQR